jgi:hypothetical protein
MPSLGGDSWFDRNIIGLSHMVDRSTRPPPPDRGSTPAGHRRRRARGTGHQMASSVEVLAARLRQILDQVHAADRVVARGLELIGQAAGTFAQVTLGSNAAEPNDVAAQLASAQRALTEAQSTLAGVTRRIVHYLAVLGFTTASPASPPSGRATPTAPSSVRIDALRAQLPSPVVPGSGQKTHGRWIGPDGTDRPIVSGRDAETVHGPNYRKTFTGGATPPWR